MEVAHSEPARDNPECEIRLGVASWDSGNHTAQAVKYTSFDKTGRASRSGEFPVEAVPQMLAFAIRKGYISPGCMAQEHFHFFAEVLAQAGLFQFMEERDRPLTIGGSSKYSPFPCIDTDEGRLREANNERDEHDDIRRDDPIDIRPILGGQYYVALPRTTDDTNIRRRAVQLLRACQQP